MTFVVATRKLEQLTHWVKVSDVFKTDSDAALLKRSGVSNFDDPRYEKYSRRLARLRGIRKYRMDLLERLSRRNEFLIDSHHPLRETLMLQTGQTVQARHTFLNDFHTRARTALIHTWEAEEIDVEPF
jgi:hypothetical protein